jgi:hypothetical protein
MPPLLPPNAPAPLTPFLNVTCQDSWHDPSGSADFTPLPGPHTCSFFAAGVVQSCSIAAGETSCAKSILAPVTLKPSPFQAPSVPGSQATCHLDEQKSSVQPSGCDGNSNCPLSFARNALVSRAFACDSSSLVSITVNNASSATVPNHASATVRWTAKSSAGLCAVSSIQNNATTHKSFPYLVNGVGSTGSIVTPSLANANEPFDFILTCQNAAGDKAVARATVFVQQ